MINQDLANAILGYAGTVVGLAVLVLAGLTGWASRHRWTSQRRWTSAPRWTSEHRWTSDHDSAAGPNSAGVDQRAAAHTADQRRNPATTHAAR
jgi:hypothetical protein